MSALLHVMAQVFVLVALEPVKAAFDPYEQVVL
jgi:hypothetical protein